MGLELTSNLTDLLDVKVRQLIGFNGMYCFPAMDRFQQFNSAIFHLRMDSYYRYLFPMT